MEKVSKIKISIEAEDISSLCSKLYLELQRYNAVRSFIDHTIEYMDIDALKDIERKVSKRISYIKELQTVAWDEKSAERYLKKLSQDAKKILEIIKQSERITKSELMKKSGFQPMKIAGLMAGMNNMAVKMGKRPVILREYIRSEGRWDIEYRLEHSFSELIKQI
jgi:hypothetical protein